MTAKTQLEKSLYWMLELKSDWEKWELTAEPEYRELMQDIKETQEFLNRIKSYAK